MAELINFSSWTRVEPGERARSRVNLEQTFYGLNLRDGKHLYASGGEFEVVQNSASPAGSSSAARKIALLDLKENSHPAACHHCDGKGIRCGHLGTCVIHVGVAGKQAGALSCPRIIRTLAC